jgi:hypothetical protein
MVVKSLKRALFGIGRVSRWTGHSTDRSTGGRAAEGGRLRQCAQQSARRIPAIEQRRTKLRPAKLDDDIDRPLLAACCPTRSASCAHLP